MVFVRGDVKSVTTVADTLKRFALVSGSSANPNKSNVYFGGVSQSVRDEILRLTGYSEGAFSFRYLEVSLNEGKLNRTHFVDLIGKVQKALNHLSTRMLSYAERIQLLNSIVFGLENYWCSTLLIPKGVVKWIQGFCRKFLWHKHSDQKRIILKSCLTSSSAHSEGGFKIKEILSWNKAFISK
ncbi:hypothetical protein RND81_11G092500 [Saponaria officinalis]|uniref:Uncharacterized protein n=1 Tax=Saponaria officinalis TaxID=3572 RepID=A0AAW1HJZ9_SAPOF